MLGQSGWCAPFLPRGGPKGNELHPPAAGDGFMGAIDPYSLITLRLAGPCSRASATSAPILRIPVPRSRGRCRPGRVRPSLAAAAVPTRSNPPIAPRGMGLHHLMSGLQQVTDL